MKKIIRFLPLLTIAILASCSSEVLPPQVEVQPAPPVVNPPSTTGNETLLPPLYPFSDKSYFIKGESSVTSNVDISAFFKEIILLTWALSSIMAKS
jgi:hypothetical protein